MKNLISYNYFINKANIYKKKNIYIIKYNEEIYELVNIENEEVVKKQYEITKNDNNYNKIVLNRNNEIITNYNNKQYVLIKKINHKVNILNTLLNRNNIYMNEYKNKKWSELWSKKIDYIEIHNNYYIGEYKLIDESINYYLGMTETAISYINYNQLNNNNEEYYLSHKRINENDFSNPLNVILDYKERDYAEYLKYLFFSNEYKKVNIEEIIKKYKLTYSGAIKLYSRLLYPEYYYDLYEKIIRKEIKEIELKKILIRIDEYELYLKKIYNILENNNIVIPQIEWL